jgi:hypothetical protein
MAGRIIHYCGYCEQPFTEGEALFPVYFYKTGMGQPGPPVAFVHSGHFLVEKV